MRRPAARPRTPCRPALCRVRAGRLRSPGDPDRRRALRRVLAPAVLASLACVDPVPDTGAASGGAEPPTGTAGAFRARQDGVGDTLRLPPARREGPVPLERALALRRSVRAFGEGDLPAEQLGQLLWAAQGVNRSGGYRTAPSAGALYPLELLVADAAGLRRYDPAAHALTTVGGDDIRVPLARAALGQSWIAAAPVVVVVTGVVERTARKYGDRAQRYVWLEAGHVAQNLLLQAAALGLGGTTVGAFDDTAVSRLLGLPGGEAPLVIIPVGVPAGPD